MSTISKSGQNADASYEISADRASNTLYLEFSGTLTADEMRTAADETIDAAERLSEGFHIVNDISENAFQRRLRQAGYEGKTATTVAEAERKLK